MAIGEPEFVKNPEPRCPVILLVDTSSSMSGAPIEQLNNGLQLFKKEVSEDSQAALRVEVAIITLLLRELALNTHFCDITRKSSKAHG